MPCAVGGHGGKAELEQQFFEDLKIWFNEFDKVKWTPPDLAAESIILLINKLIFARTIEDFGLVPYRYTQDAYAQHTRDWQAKGPHRIVPKFLAQFEEFFDDYYDTEIFSARVWDRLDKDPANLQRFCEKLNFILGINTWDQTFSTRGIVHYNYRRIDEDIFGKSYEMFLAANRKDEGIYYTPAGITGPMADSLVNSLAGKITNEICNAVGSQQCNFKRADKLMAQLAEIRVADTACGSGGFLIKALRSFWNQYQRIDAACAWVLKILKPDNGEMFLAEMPPNVEAALAFAASRISTTAASSSRRFCCATSSAWTGTPARSKWPRPTSGRKPSSSRPPITIIATSKPMSSKSCPISNSISTAPTRWWTWNCQSRPNGWPNITRPS